MSGEPERQHEEQEGLREPPVLKSGEAPERGPEGEGPESGRRVRGKPGTEEAKRIERERDRSHAHSRRASTPADPEEQTDFSGLEKKLEEPEHSRESERRRSR